MPRPVEGSAPKHVERVELGAVSDEEPRYCHVVRHAARVVVRKMPVAVDSGGAHVHRVFPVVVGQEVWSGDEPNSSHSDVRNMVSESR